MGAILIVCSTTLFSLIILNYKKEQIQGLSSCVSVLNIIKQELKKSSETEKIFIALKESEIKYYNADSNIIKFVSAEDQIKINEIFDMLGKRDLDSQLEAIEDKLIYFEKEKEEFANYYQSHKRLYLAFGILSGIFICVLLM